MPRQPDDAAGEPIALPTADHIGALSVEQALRLRRSRREFAATAIKLKDVAQLLWSAQGATGAAGLRTAPSAGETYPLDTLLLAASVDGLEPGLYTYQTRGHRLHRRRAGDLRKELAAVALDQAWVREAAAILIFTAEAVRSTDIYGLRGERYVYMETGAVGQNISLQAASIGLGCVLTAAFQDDGVAELLDLPDGHRPVLLVPVGNLP